MVMRLALAIFTAALGLVLLFPLVVLGVPFVLIAWLTRGIARAVEPPVVRWPQIFEFDTLLGWRAKNNLDCHVLEDRGDVFHVVTDRYGWAGNRTIDDSQMIVIGDSHAWGYGTDHKHTFGQLAGDVSIKAVGVPGYNLVQELLLMEQLAPQLKSKLVVWFVYVGNDLTDNLSPEAGQYRLPFVRQVGEHGSWEIVTRHLSPDKWRASDAVKFRRYYAVLPALHSDTFLAKRAYAACDYILARGAKVCTEAGAKLVVLSIPSPEAMRPDEMAKLSAARGFTRPVDLNLPDRKLRESCARHAISFVPLKDLLESRHFQDRDDHWTEEGHRRVADLLQNIYQEHRIAPPKSVRSNGNR